MLVIGTVPFEIEIIDGKAKLKEKKIEINSLTLPVTIGTTALLAAAIHVLSTLGKPLPHVILSGDKGDGKGTKRLFSYLKDCNLTRETVICGHYMMPYVDEFKKIFPKLRKNAKFIIADAGMMYAAKAAGLARNLDIFTPDAGELAFLADKNATHPAYVKKVLFEIDTEEMESLIIFKTKKELVKELFKKIKELHPYEVPFIGEIEVKKVNEEYMKWLKKVTK